MTAGPDTISVVLPTYNRLPALRETLPVLLEMDGIAEVVVVVDGSSDGTGAWLAELENPRLRVVEQANQGSPAARNRGVDAARSPWILMTEDDCTLPAEFATTLLAVAREHGAQIVGAPWVTLEAGETITGAMRRSRSRAQARIGLFTHPGVFPLADRATPFLNGIFLAHRTVFDHVRYHEFGGNAWREETDLFLTANDRGFRSILTPRTASLQLHQWDGGQRRPRLRYEAWILLNNWRFLRRHEVALRALGEISTPVGAQATFAADRLGAMVGGFLSARLGRFRAWRADSAPGD